MWDLRASRGGARKSPPSSRTLRREEARSGPSEVGLKVVGRLQRAGAQLPLCWQKRLVQAAWPRGCHTQLSVGLGGQGDRKEEGRILTPDPVSPFRQRVSPLASTGKT